MNASAPNDRQEAEPEERGADALWPRVSWLNRPYTPSALFKVETPKNGSSLSFPRGPFLDIFYWLEL